MREELSEDHNCCGGLESSNFWPWGPEFRLASELFYIIKKFCFKLFFASYLSSIAQFFQLS
jgi:hypothetical protein